MNGLHVHGIPVAIPEAEAALCRSRLLRAVDALREETGAEDVDIRITKAQPESFPSPDRRFGERDELSVAERAARYTASAPLWGMDRLIAPATLLDELDAVVRMAELETLVFDTWGMRTIEPFPRSVLNFHGPPGTGKTLAAHAVASSLGRSIIAASYADIESKYHGDGPKNVEALFFAAQRDNAVLFVDEADSLLSKRLTNVTQGSEQAINSMRSQLLICLERHRGVVIFATNLIENYDSAFQTRVRNIRFCLPDEEARAAIWRAHLPVQLPLADDVDIASLAVKSDGFCGREIKQAVLDAVFRAARLGQAVCQEDFLGAIERVSMNSGKVC